MTQPFNEDHPDFESYIQGLSEGVGKDEQIIQMIQLACPTQMLLFLLRDEINGIRRHYVGVVASFAAVLMWIIAPILLSLFLNASRLPNWFVPVSFLIGIMHGTALVLQYSSLRHRWRRYEGFIKPAHAALVKVLKDPPE